MPFKINDSIFFMFLWNSSDGCHFFYVYKWQHWVLEISIKKTSILISGQYFTVWILIQTSFQVINDKIFFAIIHRSRIKHPFTSIIKESIRYCQNEFQFKIKILGLKIYKKKTCYWCMKILDYWLNKSHKYVKTKIE